MEVIRPFWINKVEKIWKKTSIIWLAGVRRSGKTTLSKSIDGSIYFNCDLPSVQEELKNPEQFLKSTRAKTIILDEIHQLTESSMLLKIAADHFNHIKILATGSSTLVAGKKFKDTLTGRKRNIHFLPVLIQELSSFNVDIKKRILHGGLPPAMICENLDLDFYAEWMDSFYARDIQELFAVDKRQPFLKVLEYLMISNGNLFEITKLAQASGITRPTVIKYLDILEITKAITVLRPFAKNSEQELVSQPKVYAFDTGFCCYSQGIRNLGPNDYGYFLENLTLETFQAHDLNKDIKFWRTKAKKEIDFVLTLSRNNILIVECKWKEKNFSDDAFEVFRSLYPQGENWIITSDSITRTETNKKMTLRFININDLSLAIEKLKRD
jgi:predicted AAA+ superfamily ATPase